MPDVISSLPIGIIGIIVAVILIIAIVLSMWKKIPQDKAAVVTGLKKRVITGRSEERRAGKE